jgi:hypothetical protein
MFLGIFFLAMGVFILLSAMGIVTGITWNYFWAFVFILIGIKIMFKGRGCCGGFMHHIGHKHMHGKDGCCSSHHRGKDGDAENGEYKESEK